MKFSFLHISDIHLGRPFSDLPITGGKLELCSQACSFALNNIVDFAISKKVEFILIAGDSFDSEEHDLGTKLSFIKSLKKLADNGIKSYIICGNHDPIKLYKKYESYFKFEDKYSEYINIAGVTTKEFASEFSPIKGVNIYALSFEKEEGVTPIKYLQKVSSKKEKDFNIGLIHCDLDKTESKYSPCSKEDLRKLGYDYYALGHIHIPSDEGDNIVYSGTPQGRTKKETGVHGFYFVSVDNKKITKEFIPSDIVRFEEFDLDCAGLRNKSEVFEKITELVNNLDSEVELSLFEVTLKGLSEAYEDLNDSDSLISEYIENYSENERNNVCTYRINNETYPEVDDNAIILNTGIIGIIANSFSENSKINTEEIYQNISDIHENIYKKLKLDDYSKEILSESLEVDKEEIMLNVKNELKSLCKEIYNME